MNTLVNTFIVRFKDGEIMLSDPRKYLRTIERHPEIKQDIASAEYELIREKELQYLPVFGAN